MKLPNEILLLIFDYYLTYEEVRTCRLVCKHWNELIKKFYKIRQLAVLNSNFYAYPCKFFYTYENVFDCQHKIISSIFNLTKLNLDRFANLKQLYILYKSVTTDLLNNLKELENVAIRSSRFIQSGNNSLNLDNLKVLSIEESELINEIVLNVPKLTCLKIFLFKSYKSKLEFRYPNTIELLECARYYSLIKSFTNLKVLYCERLVDLALEPLLTINKELNEIHFSGDEHTFYSLKKQSQLLGKNDLKIFFLSANLSDCDRFLDYDLVDFGMHIDESTVDFYVQNYAQLADCLFSIKFVNYNCLEDHFEKIPKNFFKKIVNLYQLEITDAIKDLNQFEVILKECGYLNKIYINTFDLDADFFNHLLPTCCSNIKCLEIKNNRNLNLDFLLKFKSLEAIIIDQNLSTNLIRKLYDKYKIKHLSFYYQESSLFLAEINLNNDENVFKLNVLPINRDFDNLDDLLGFLDNESYKTDFLLDLSIEEKLFIKTRF